MTALLPPLPALFAAWWRRLFVNKQPAPQPRNEALESAALDRLLPMMLGNAPHPYQAGLLLFLMDEQRKQQRPRD